MKVSIHSNQLKSGGSVSVSFERSILEALTDCAKWISEKMPMSECDILDKAKFVTLEKVTVYVVSGTHHFYTL